MCLTQRQVSKDGGARLAMSLATPLFYPTVCTVRYLLCARALMVKSIKRRKDIKKEKGL